MEESLVLKQKKKNPNKMRHLIAKLNPSSPVTEQYRTIRTNLHFSSVDEALSSVLVTSAGPGAGKSITAANLAIVYAQQEKKTLLIDADMRKPTMHYTFRLGNLTGLSNVLIGESPLEQAVETSGVDFLDVLSCGPIPPNPSELLASRRMKEVLEHAKTLYDFIILDTPPVLAVTDAKVIANIVEGSLFVVRSGETNTEEATRGLKTIQDAEAKFLGAILNDVPKTSQSYYSYYG